MNADSIMIYIQHRNDSIAHASRQYAEMVLMRRDLLTSPVLESLIYSIAIVVAVIIAGRIAGRIRGL